MTGHPFSLKHTAGGGAGSVGTLVTVELGTMLHGSPVLSQSLDRTLETFSLGDGRCVDLVAFRKDIDLNLRTQGIFFRVVELELPDISLCAYAGLLEMSHLGLVRAMSVDDFLPRPC